MGAVGRGSGGDAIGLKKDILIDHEVLGIYDKYCDGLIGLKLCSKTTGLQIGLVGMYLSPDNYIYGQDSETFFNNATALWQELIDCDLLIGGGDLNSRTKEQLDYIQEIDGNLVPLRYNPDKT